MLLIKKLFKKSDLKKCLVLYIMETIVNQEVKKVEMPKVKEPKPKLCKSCGSCDNHFGLRRNSLCTPCRSKKANANANEKNYFKKYYDINKEKMKENAKEYYDINKEKMNEKSKEYYKATKAKLTVKL